MSDIGTESYNAVYNSLPAARINVRVEDGNEYGALCPGVGFSRTNNEMGLGLDPDVTVRMLAADVPDGMEIGKIITVIEASGRETVWRINGAYTTAGITKFMIEAQHG